MATKHYPPEFRAEAVVLYRSRPGSTIRAVAQALGINHETLRSWIRDRQSGVEHGQDHLVPAGVVR